MPHWAHHPNTETSDIVEEIPETLMSSANRETLRNLVGSFWRPLQRNESVAVVVTQVCG